MIRYGVGHYHLRSRLAPANGYEPARTPHVAGIHCVPFGAPDRPALLPLDPPHQPPPLTLLGHVLLDPVGQASAITCCEQVFGVLIA